MYAWSASISRGLNRQLYCYSRDLGSGSNLPKQDLTEPAENPRRSNFNNYSEHVYCATYIASLFPSGSQARMARYFQIVKSDICRPIQCVNQGPGGWNNTGSHQAHTMRANKYPPKTERRLRSKLSPKAEEERVNYRAQADYFTFPVDQTSDAKSL